jgi:hypothetical protein
MADGRGIPRPTRDARSQPLADQTLMPRTQVPLRNAFGLFQLGLMSGDL